MTARVVTLIGGTVGLASGLLAGLAMWLILTRPVMLASTPDGHAVAALFRAFVGAAYELAAQLLGYL